MYVSAEFILSIAAAILPAIAAAIIEGTGVGRRASIMKDVKLYKSMRPLACDDVERAMLDAYRSRIIDKFKMYGNLTYGRARWLRPFVIFTFGYLFIWLFMKALFGSIVINCGFAVNAGSAFLYGALMAFLWYKFVR